MVGESIKLRQCNSFSGASCIAKEWSQKYRVTIHAVRHLTGWDVIVYKKGNPKGQIDKIEEQLRRFPQSSFEHLYDETDWSDAEFSAAEHEAYVDESQWEEEWRRDAEYDLLLSELEADSGFWHRSNEDGWYYDD